MKKLEQAKRLRKAVFSGRMKLNGKEHEDTLVAADNYALSLLDLKHWEAAKSLLRKMMPVARRVLGDGNDVTIRMRSHYAQALCRDANATLDDLCEAVTTFEDVVRIARRLLGGAHPLVLDIESDLRAARAMLRARETPSPGSA